MKNIITMKQPTKKERELIEREFLERIKKTGLETDEGMFYPDNCELGTVYSPEECKKLGILI